MKKNRTIMDVHHATPATPVPPGPGMRARMRDRHLDNFWRLVWASMNDNTMDEKNKSIRYAYRKTIASKMRREGFKFYPVLKNEDQENLERIKKLCDYHFTLEITGGTLKLGVYL